MSVMNVRIMSLSAGQPFFRYESKFYCRTLATGGKVYFIAIAGRHQTCLPSWRKESSALVYARYVSSEILWMGLKNKKFSW